MAEERLVNVNLRRKLLEKPVWKRKQATATTLRQILERRAKGKVKIDEKLNEEILKGKKKFRVKLVEKEGVFEALPA